MAAKLSQGTIKDIEVVHRKHLTTFDGYQRCARIVVWATTKRGQRVWVRTVEGGLDPLDIGIKVAMAQEFFKKLVGRKISFHKSENDDTLFAEEKSLPKKFLVSYQEIKKSMWKWVEANCTEKLAKLRKEKSSKATATRKANAEAKESWRKQRAADLGLPKDASWDLIEETEEKERRKREAKWRAEEELRQKKWLEERRKNALRLVFRKGYNPKYGTEQWEARHDGRLFVLRREDQYEPSEGEIPVEERFDLVLGRIVLVQRI